MRASIALVLGLAVATAGSRPAWAETAPRASGAATVCVLPLSSSAAGQEELCFRFWAGFMDQVSRVPILTTAPGGFLQRAATVAGTALAAVPEAKLKAIADATKADWVLTGTLSTTGDGKLRAQGTAYRRADGSMARTRGFVIGEGERDRAITEIALATAKLAASAAPAAGVTRIPSLDAKVAAIGLQLEQVMEAQRGGNAAVAETLADGLASAVSGLLDAVPQPYPLAACEELLRSTIAALPRHLPTVVALARVHAMSGRSSDAKAAFDYAQQLGKDDARADELIGRAYYSCGMLDEALRVVMGGLRRNADSAPLDYLLGLVQSAQGRQAEAETSFLRAARLDPGGEPGLLARFSLGAMYLRQGKLDDALQILEETISGAPDVADAHYNHALALHSIGRTRGDKGMLAKASEEYKAAIKLDPLHPGAHCNLGVLMAADGDYMGAIGHFLKALEGDGTLTSAARNLAIAYENAGDRAGAADAWLKYAGMPGVSADKAKEAKDRAAQLSKPAAPPVGPETPPKPAE